MAHKIPSCFRVLPVPVKRHRGEPGHTRDTRDTRAHAGTRITRTNLTTIHPNPYTVPVPVARILAVPVQTSKTPGEPGHPPPTVQHYRCTARGTPREGPHTHEENSFVLNGCSLPWLVRLTLHADDVLLATEGASSQRLSTDYKDTYIHYPDTYGIAGSAGLCAVPHHFVRVGSQLPVALTLTHSSPATGTVPVMTVHYSECFTKFFHTYPVAMFWAKARSQEISTPP